MIIPVYNEYDYILSTLKSINYNDLSYLSDLLVVLVINNSKDEDKAIIKSNKQTHKLIINQKYNFEYTIIDWKTSKKIPTTSFNNKTGIKQTTSNILDVFFRFQSCEFWPDFACIVHH